MGGMRRKLKARIAIYGMYGGLLGYLILHPVSLVIRNMSDPAHTVTAYFFFDVFSLHHLPMGLYYTFLGIVVGIMQGYYIHVITHNVRRMKILESLLPICSKCKAIRDDKGTRHGHGVWKPLETYIGEHLNTEFSHTVCPDCFKSMYPDLVGKIHDSSTMQT